MLNTGHEGGERRFDLGSDVIGLESSPQDAVEPGKWLAGEEPDLVLVPRVSERPVLLGEGLQSAAARDLPVRLLGRVQRDHGEPVLLGVEDDLAVVAPVPTPPLHVLRLREQLLLELRALLGR